MKEQNQENNLEVSGFIAKTEQYVKKNKKGLTIAGCVVVALVVGIFAYVKLVSQPRQLRAAEDMFPAEQYFNEGNYELALNGNDEVLGFAGVIDEYGCTKSGNLAKYYAGICQLNLGKFNEAIDYLKSYKGKDDLTNGEKLMLIGDAYAELENDGEAVSYYEKAAKECPNFVVAPSALWKAGILYIKMNQKDKAVNVFNQIKENYPESTEYSEVDKVLAYAENMQ